LLIFTDGSSDCPGVLSFGLVAIPVEIHTATKNETVSFNLLHAKCGSRVRNRNLCPVCNEVVERDDLVRGYELAKGQYVQVTDDELVALEAERNSNIELREFIPIAKVDPVYFEGAYYLAPSDGGDKAYRLLAEAMEKSGRVALAEMVSYGKERLVLIRPAKGGLVLQVTRFGILIRFPKPKAWAFPPQEMELGAGLIEKLSSENFEPENYDDEYRNRVLAMIDEKRKGREIAIPPSAPADPPRHRFDGSLEAKHENRSAQTQTGGADEAKKT
jgi:DNA end-binding protein Ku